MARSGTTESRRFNMLERKEDRKETKFTLEMMFASDSAAGDTRTPHVVGLLVFLAFH